MIKEIEKEIKEFFKEAERKSLEKIKVEEPKRKEFGDLSTNAALVLSKDLGRSPKDIAKELSEYLKSLPYVEKVEIAGPGFVNIFLGDGLFHLLKRAEAEKERFGSSNLGAGKSVLVEFVSANPTGPLHIGHGRIAAFGDAVSRILRKAGYRVLNEYYVNDAGTQMEILGRSVYLRYMELFLKKVEFPKDHYQGDYIRTIAEEIKRKEGDIYLNMSKEEAVEKLSEKAAKIIMEWIKKDLERFGVKYDSFFSEKSLYTKGKVEEALKLLLDKGFIYEEDGALWFKSSLFGDEKDRVVRRKNGQYTYFASDIAYHMDKFKRGFDLLIDIWGADHHGYVERLKGSVSAMGFDADRLKIILVQMVNLIKGGKQIPMSTRKGEFYPLEKLLDEVGKDVARFIYLTRDSSSPLDFDIDKAKEMSSENPVFYVQYCHARICSVKRKAEEKGIKEEDFLGQEPSALRLPEEKEIAKKVLFFPKLVEDMAENLEPHKLTYYLYNLSSSFHSYYNKYRIVENKEETTLSRLFLSEMVRRTVQLGLELLGVSAPEAM